MGAGPMEVQALLKVIGPPDALGVLLIASAALAAFDRSAPACSALSFVSPAVRRVMNAWSSASNRASVSSSSSGYGVPGIITGASPIGDGTTVAMPGPTPAAKIATHKIDALIQRSTPFPIFLSTRNSTGIEGSLETS